MSTAGPPESAPDASAIAARLREAAFVRLFAAPDGDALAALGLLARALGERDVAYQASVTRRPIADADADLTVAVGRSGGDLALAGTTALSVTASGVARALDATPDAALALAGAYAAGDDPGAHADLLDAAGLDRRAGIAAPTDDLADGLAHTTLAHAPFSGRPEAAAKALAGVEREGRTLASLLALSVLEGASDAPRASEAVERALRPYAPGGPFDTLAGYGDVLDAVARARPGVGVALALGHDRRDAALDAWREHARAAHEAVREAALERYDGYVVVRAACGSALDTVARLVRDFRSPEPIAVAIDGEAGSAAVAADRDVATLVSETAAAVGGRATGRGRRAHVDLAEDGEDGENGAGPEAFIETLRRGLRA
ncbi:hypothetical protein ACFQPA_06935 [Halomarina halobia]|uniref:Exonuclease RecJ n=1 Tax=Halomarina halobia TaxID=3033386 RepID=A0ABD6ACX7_9EURY|nr:hypothetical protein [Halomarina sp. PSR21]